VAHGWILTGYSYKNVAGMLEWYREGRVGRDAPQNGNGRHDRTGSNGEPAHAFQPGEVRWLSPEEQERGYNEWKRQQAAAVSSV